ncbi:MAG: DUF302 domain-containing protein [Myxococcota bacterium]|nr:DUF302 domain-containing protein [Myxococcota bacterium]
MKLPRTALVALVALRLLVPSLAAAEDGLVSLPSQHGVKETADRLEVILAEKGLTVFARIDHAAGAAGVGQSLPPTQLVIFGNPKVGSPLMRCAPTVAIDLPQKALIREDAEGRVWISYNDPAHLRSRHAIEGCDAVLEKVSGVLAGVTKAAAN